MNAIDKFVYFMERKLGRFWGTYLAILVLAFVVTFSIGFVVSLFSPVITLSLVLIGTCISCVIWAILLPILYLFR